MRKTLTKKQKLELELVAIELWFQTFGKNGMSSDNQRVYMSGVLKSLLDKLDLCKRQLLKKLNSI